MWPVIPTDYFPRYFDLDIPQQFCNDLFDNEVLPGGGRSGGSDVLIGLRLKGLLGVFLSSQNITTVEYYQASARL